MQDILVRPLQDWLLSSATLFVLPFVSHSLSRLPLPSQLSGLLHLDFDEQPPSSIGPMAPREFGPAMAHATDHSREYYQQMEEDFNVLEFTQRVYEAGSENMLSLVKRF